MKRFFSVTPLELIGPAPNSGQIQGKTAENGC
jgi:hypothetical protein